MLDPDRIEEKRGHAGNHEEFILVVSKAAGTEGPGGPYFDRKSNPISTRGTNYAQRILMCIKILAPDFQTLQWSCVSKQAERTRRIPLPCRKASVSSLSTWRNILPTIGIPFKKSNRPLGLLILEQRVPRSITIKFFLQF